MSPSRMTSRFLLPPPVGAVTLAVMVPSVVGSSGPWTGLAVGAGAVAAGVLVVSGVAVRVPVASGVTVRVGVAEGTGVGVAVAVRVAVAVAIGVGVVVEP